MTPKAQMFSALMLFMASVAHAQSPSVGEAQSFLQANLGGHARMEIHDKVIIANEDFYFQKVQLKESHPCVFAATIKSTSYGPFVFGIDFKKIESIKPVFSDNGISKPYETAIWLNGDAILGTGQPMKPQLLHAILLRFSTPGMRDRTFRALEFLKAKCPVEGVF